VFSGDVEVHGGEQGINAMFADAGGRGGEGRVRFDGATPFSLQPGPISATGSIHPGCAVSAVSETVLDLTSNTACEWTALDVAGNVVGSGTVTANGSVDTTTLFNTFGELTVIFTAAGVPNPVGIGRVVFDVDNDGIPDFADIDSDNDGISDVDESGGLDLSGDTDRDGVPDYLDPDSVDCEDTGNDGICDSLAPSIDHDGDGIPNVQDLDSDDDGVPDISENGRAELDLNRDGILDDPTDSDRDGLAATYDLDDNDPNVRTTSDVLFTDSDDAPDLLDLDADGDGDGDGDLDIIESGGIDTDNNGLVDDLMDTDLDRLADDGDPSDGGVGLTEPDADNDGVPDFQDTSTNTRIRTGELCDDGNLTEGDGCDAACSVEDGWECESQPSDCAPLPVCGNGLIEDGETCDDGNTMAGDGCDHSCSVEPGFDCEDAPSDCFALPACGDGVVDLDEACDDGNTVAGDGCDLDCAIEDDFECSGAPSDCVETPVIAQGGCGCTSTSSPMGWWLVLLAPMMGLLRRR
jgi:cysteine-rich repeat protein